MNWSIRVNALRTNDDVDSITKIPNSINGNGQQSAALEGVNSKNSVARATLVPLSILFFGRTQQRSSIFLSVV